VLVQDASYMVMVPDLVTDTPPLRRNPVFIYYSDRFTLPQPFRADIVVSIDDVFEKKMNMLDAHVSQCYEWLPWTEGQLEQVPKDPAERKKWLAAGPLATRKLQPEWREALEKRYGAQAARVQHAEAFEITEYGHQPSEEEIRKHFSMLKLLRSPSTDISRARKRFANSSHFSRTGRNTLGLISFPDGAGKALKPKAIRGAEALA